MAKNAKRGKSLIFDEYSDKLLSQSKHFKKLVQKGLREIEEGKTRPWKEVWDEL